MPGVRPDVEENPALIDKMNKATDASRQHIKDDNVLALLMATSISSRAIERMPFEFVDGNAYVIDYKDYH